jgi:hypothetical protein
MMFRALLFATALAVLTGCAFTEPSSMNPDFAGSMKLTPGLFTSPQPLSELPGSRVRERD